MFYSAVRKEETIKQQTCSPLHEKRGRKGGLVKGSLLRAQQKLTSSRTSLLGAAGGRSRRGSRAEESSSSTCISPDILDSSPDLPMTSHSDASSKKPLYTEIGSNNIPLSTTTRPSSLFGTSKSKGTNTGSSKVFTCREMPPVERTRQRRYHRHLKGKSHALLTANTPDLTSTSNCSSPSMVRRVSLTSN